MIWFNGIFNNAISKKNTEKDLPLSKIINTEKISGKFNGLPITYDNFIDMGFKNEWYYLDLWNLFLTLQRYFNAVFRWNGLSLKENRILENILFKRGSCLVYKMPDGKLLISEYTLKKDTMNDLYDYPKEVIINCLGNPLNGKTIKKDFVIIYNNSSLKPTLLPLWNRIIHFIQSIEKNDKVSITSDVKVPYSDNSDSLKSADLNDKWYSDNVFIKVNSEWLRSEKIQPIVLQNAGKEKQEIQMFHIDMILMWLGLKAQNINMKRERETELEISNNDKFEGKIIEDAYNMRLEGSEAIKEKLRLSISPKEPERITEAKLEHQKAGGGDVQHHKDWNDKGDTND